MLKVCRITATKPSIVTKRFNIIGGALQKETSASVYAGSMEVVKLTGFDTFADLLVGLRTNQCLTYGVPPRDAALVTEKQWVKSGKPADRLPRSRTVYKWPEGPGVLMLDYDAPKDGTPVLDRDGLIAALTLALPGLATAPALWWPSTSSCIYMGDNELAGIKGQRIYLLVKDATDIQRAGKALMTGLWALGFGRFEVSASGSVLERCLFDTSVWQANRIDFAAGAHCGPGLEQRRGHPLRIGSGDEPLDTLASISEPTDAKMEAAKEARLDARKKIAGEAEATRQRYVVNRTAKLVDAGCDETVAKELVIRAVEKRDLGGDWPLILCGDEGQKVSTTVLEVLDNPHQYHSMKTLDPLEPEYDGGRWVGKLYLFSARPTLHSFAHGGVSFRLNRQLDRIELVAGKSREATDALLDKFRKAPDLFDFGTELVTVYDGSLHPLNEHGVSYAAAGVTQFWRWHKLPTGGQVEQLANPPADICKKVLSLGNRRELKRLEAVITAPTLRPDGTVLSAPGFDTTTHLLYETDELAPDVPMQPTRDQTLAALNTLWEPFKDFPFVGPIDQAVHLAALLTAAVRAVLPTAPAFAYDAPVQGSGKTLLARCVGVLASGVDPGVWPHTAGRDDEEVRKRLFAVLRSGARCIVWDNVVGQFDSAAMAAAITSPTYQDRILGASTSSTVPNKAMIVLTGNNLSLAGEMPRRVMVCRIDPATDRPFARNFDLDPFSYCQQNRQLMIAAALVVLRESIAVMDMLGCQHAQGKLASFEQWDDWVRQAVFWANKLRPGMFGDVMESITANQTVDPEQETLGALLTSWLAVFGGARVSARDVVQRLNESMYSAETPISTLREALHDMTHGNLTPKSVGRALMYRMGRFVNNQRLVRHPGQGGVFLWCIEPSF